MPKMQTLPYFGTVETKEQNQRLLFSALLAAGRSRRFGRAKQLECVADEPLVARGIRVAEQATGDCSMLVAGYAARDVVSACSPMRGFIVVNDHYRSGMASSIVAAVRALPASADGLLILLADQPLVDANVLERLVSRWRETPGSIVCSRSAQGRSPPVIFPREVFPDLCRLEGDRGARAVIEQYGEIVIEVDVPEAATDIDTPDDLAQLARE